MRNIKLSPSAWRFFKDENIHAQTRMQLLKKCLSLRYDPTPEGHSVDVVKGEHIYRLVTPGARICYMVEETLITILLVLVNIPGAE